MGNFLDMPKKVRRSFQGEGTHKLPSPLTHISLVPPAPYPRLKQTNKQTFITRLK